MEILKVKEDLDMSNANTSTQPNTKSTVWQIIGRLVTAAIVLGITAFLHLDLE